MKSMTSLAFVAVVTLQGSLFAGVAHATDASEVFTKDEMLLVHKSPTCGCCSGWVEHMQMHGAQTKVSHPANLNQMKTELGIPSNARSCHTAVSKDGYVFEGHIPAKFIQQYLANPTPKTKGLVVPAMPVGSPGMEYNGQFMPYAVHLLHDDGSLSEYAKVMTPEDQV